VDWTGWAKDLSILPPAPYLWNERWVRALLVEHKKMGVASESDPYTKVFRLGPLLGLAAAGYPGL
jgi:hypothetical protein